MTEKPSGSRCALIEADSSQPDPRRKRAGVCTSYPELTRSACRHSTPTLRDAGDEKVASEFIVPPINPIPLDKTEHVLLVWNDPWRSEFS